MDAIELFINIAFMFGLSWLAWKFVMRVRRYLWDSEDDSMEGAFTLNALRELHRAGKLTAEEYEKLKLVVVAAAKKAADRIAAQIAQRADELDKKKKKRPPFVPPYN